jgi:hypothetical protein
MRRALTFLILAAAGVALLISPVIGHERRTDSDVFINFAAGGLYKGKVVSPRDACERNRTVHVWHDSDPPFHIGKTTTENDGSWRLHGPRPPAGDHVYAVMPRRILRRGNGHLHVCKFDESPDVVYPKN